MRTGEPTSSYLLSVVIADLFFFYGLSDWYFVLKPHLLPFDTLALRLLHDWTVSEMLASRARAVKSYRLLTFLHGLDIPAFLCHVVDMPSYGPVLELSVFVSPTFYVLNLLTKILRKER